MFIVNMKNELLYGIIKLYHTSEGLKLMAANHFVLKIELRDYTKVIYVNISSGKSFMIYE